MDNTVHMPNRRVKKNVHNLFGLVELRDLAEESASRGVKKTFNGCWQSNPSRGS
jgi:hypothetical protein